MQSHGSKQQRGMPGRGRCACMLAHASHAPSCTDIHANPSLLQTQRRLQISSALQSQNPLHSVACTKHPAQSTPCALARALSLVSSQVWLVAGDCFLIGLAPVLVHMSKGPDGKFPFHPVSINLLVEVAKTIFATAVLMIYVSPLHPHAVVSLALPGTGTCRRCFLSAQRCPPVWLTKLFSPQHGCSIVLLYSDCRADVWRTAGNGQAWSAIVSQHQGLCEGCAA